MGWEGDLAAGHGRLVGGTGEGQGGPLSCLLNVALGKPHTAGGWNTGAARCKVSTDLSSKLRLLLMKSLLVRDALFPGAGYSPAKDWNTCAKLFTTVGRGTCLLEHAQTLGSKWCFTCDAAREPLVTMSPGILLVPLTCPRVRWMAIQISASCLGSVGAAGANA
jgi:hypothetical protein